MKTTQSKLLCAFVALLSLYLTGCPSARLTLEDGDRLMAPVVGSKPGDVRFFNHALIAQVETEDGYAVAYNSERGLVALTDSELILVKGSENSIEEEETLRISIAEIEGLVREEDFLHLAYQGYRFLLSPYRAYVDIADYDKLEALHDLLDSENITEIEKGQVIWPRRITQIVRDGRAQDVNSGRNNYYVSHPNDRGSDQDSIFYTGDEVRDSQAFTPWQEWGQ